jgi:Zn-dependent metalloprotease
VATGCHCFIVPPGLLERIARRGSRTHRELALDTLSVDSSIRTARAVHSTFAGPRHRRLALSIGAAGQPRRTIYDAENRYDAHATRLLRWEEGPPASDPVANQAFDGLGATYRFFWDAYRRDSIDDGGLPLVGEVHFGVDYDNAFWDGERIMFGDGDGQLFTGFAGALDVIGHELTHGVTQETLGLRYMGQPGALNESISDVFGCLVKQHALGHTAAEADWLIGQGVLGPALRGVALRSMSAPGTAFEGDGQAAHMRGYVRTAADNGGVHTNSGIPNRAFHLAAVKLGGHAWEHAGRIW